MGGCLSGLSCFVEVSSNKEESCAGFGERERCFETEAGGTACYDGGLVVKVVDQTFVFYDLGGGRSSVACSLGVGVSGCVSVGDHRWRRAEDLVECSYDNILIFLGGDGNVSCVV